MKLWAILKNFSMMAIKEWEHNVDFRLMMFGEHPELDFDESPLVSKPKLIARLCTLYYAAIKGFKGKHLNKSEHLILLALATKPHGTSSWDDLEREMLQFISPSTFSQKIRSLKFQGLVFPIGRKKSEKYIVMPDEILPQVRQTFELPMQLPEENAPDFGKVVSEDELAGALHEIPEFTLSVPSPDQIFELALTKDSGKKGVLQIPAMASFEDLHFALQDFARWDDEHLHKFIVKLRHPNDNQVTVEGLDPSGNPIRFPRLGEFREDQVQLGQILSIRNNLVCYIYDLGVKRKIMIKVLHVLPRNRNITYPNPLAGKKMTPSLSKK